MQQMCLPFKSLLSSLAPLTQKKNSRVKMAVMKFLVYVTCFFLSQDLVFCDDYGESGNKITLTPSIRGNPEEILWTHNGNKVLEYDGSEVAKYGTFKDRVDVDFETGQLTIRKLNSQDSGTYQSEIWINRKAQISSHNLRVLDALPEPQVTCELDETSDFKKLSCSVESQTQPSYEWSGPETKQSGPTLLVKEQEENRNSVYTCTVKNKAVSRTTDFTLQDCHTGGVSLAVLVPVLIVIVLLIILLAVLALSLYRRKKQKWKSGLKTVDLENGECNNLLRNVPMEAMPGSSEATFPCHIRLTAQKESIADKKWDQDSESENAGETHEGQQLLKGSPQSAITENNKDDTGNTNEGELYKNEKNSKNADEEEENSNSKADETDTEVESQKSLQTQEEMEKSQILKNESEHEEESHEEQSEPPGEQDTTDADTNEEDQKPEEKKEKEEENKEIDSKNTGECNNLLRNVPMEAMPGSSEATFPCHIRLTAQKESIADKKWDQDSESENAGETHEGQQLLKESPQSAITENNKDDTGNTNEGELYKNEKNSENADEEEENTNSKADETDTEVESQKSLQTQEEMEKSQILKNESEHEEESHEEQSEPPGEQDTTDADTNEEDQKPEEKKEKEEENKEIDNKNTGECNNLLRNVPMEAMPGSSEDTLPCRIRLTAQKESIADKKWDQDSESENAGETHEGQQLLKGSPQSAITEDNKDDTGNTNEGELYKNEKNSENTDEEEENSNSKADETDTEVESQKSLQTQEDMEKSQILKNESEHEEESHEEQIETPGEQDTTDADTNEEDQKPEEKKEKEEENKETDSKNTVDTGNVAEQLHKNEKSSQNENGDQSIEQQNKSLCTSVNEDNQRSEQEKEEEEKTEKENHEGTGRLHSAEPCNPPLHSEAPSDPVDSPSNSDISVPSSNLNMELENKQAAFFSKDEDDDGEQTDKSSESELGMKEKMDVPEIKEAKNNLLKDCDVQNSDPDNTNNDISVPEDKKAETETNSFSKHAMKEDHSSEIREQYLDK